MLVMNRPRYYAPKVYRTNQNVAAFRPKVNVIESDADYQLQMALPGYERDDLTITVEENVLTITSEKTWEGEEGKQATHTEFRVAPFKRSFSLPKGLQEGKIEAKMNNGLLEVALAKQAKQVITVA